MMSPSPHSDRHDVGQATRAKSVTVSLSVVILTKNEADRIRDCIQSVQWADEVLVIDDESTDDTAAIALTEGARVLTRKMDIEGRHRNWAYAQGAHDWVFSLDADERITPELAEELRALMARGPEHVVYSTPLRNYIGNYWIRHGGWYPGRKDRFFDRHKFKYEEAEVHPRPIINGSHGRLQRDLVHYSYRHFGDFANSLNHQTTLEARKWMRDGRRVTLGKAMWRTVDRFFRSYVGKQGFRDGFVGLMVAGFAGWYQLLSYAKYWELLRDGTSHE